MPAQTTARKSIPQPTLREQARSYLPWAQDLADWLPRFVRSYGLLGAADRVALNGALDLLDEVYTKLDTLAEKQALKRIHRGALAEPRRTGRGENT